MHSHASHQLTKAAAVVIEVRHYLERRRQHVKHLLPKFGDICHIPHISSGAYTARSVSLLSHTPRLPSQSHTPTPLSHILGNIPHFPSVVHDDVMLCCRHALLVLGSCFTHALLMPHLCVAGHCGSYLWSQAFRFGRGQKQRGKRRGHRFFAFLILPCCAPLLIVSYCALILSYFGYTL